MEEVYRPEWASGRTIDEVGFCLDYLTTHNLISVDGAFFTKDGRIHNESILKKEIYDEISPFITTNVTRKVDSILSVLRMQCRKESLPYHITRIHVSNGTLHLTKGFRPEKEYCRYRLPVAYREDAPTPALWLEFLDSLLEPEDILTLQEFMGYCLIPTTMAQKMLLITGRGGEGKSRIGVVMRGLLGANMSTGSLAKVEYSPFARADLEHLLLMVDDDLKMEALSQTNNIKTIITAELPMDLERKGIQSYQGKLHVRFMAFGNGSLQALHDRSHGFFRRQIILSAKERPKDRVDDPYLSKRLEQEYEGIFIWALQGLYRLFANDFHFTISQKSKDNIKRAMAEGNNIVEFLSSEGYFRLDPMERTSSRALYRVYRDWCEDNALLPMSAKTFWAYLSQNASEYGLESTRSVPIGNGRYARGFRGIRLCSRE